MMVLVDSFLETAVGTPEDRIRYPPLGAWISPCQPKTLPSAFGCTQGVPEQALSPPVSQTVSMGRPADRDFQAHVEGCGWLWKRAGQPRSEVLSPQMASSQAEPHIVLRRRTLDYLRFWPRKRLQKKRQATTCLTNHTGADPFTPTKRDSVIRQLLVIQVPSGLLFSWTVPSFFLFSVRRTQHPKSRVARPRSARSPRRGKSPPTF